MPGAHDLCETPMTTCRDVEPPVVGIHRGARPVEPTRRYFQLRQHRLKLSEVTAAFLRELDIEAAPLPRNATFRVEVSARKGRKLARILQIGRYLYAKSRLQRPYGSGRALAVDPGLPTERREKSREQLEPLGVGLADSPGPMTPVEVAVATRSGQVGDRHFRGGLCGLGDVRMHLITVRAGCDAIPEREEAALRAASSKSAP